MTQREILWRRARTLRPRRVRGKALPRLLLFTDPARTPGPERIAARLPRGAGVVYRAFGAADAVARGRRLRRIAWRRGLVLLAGADEKLAAAIRADGVHLPERSLALATRLRRARPGWIVTGAAHSVRALAAARRADVDAVVISPVFPSHSASAGRPLGPLQLAMLVRRAGAPAYALGGVDARTAARIAHVGLTGFAAVEALT
jgi:thiamine-phosphate pyrophosphorylase